MMNNLMSLYVATPDENYPILRLESKNRVWEMGIYPTMYGTRVSCGRIGSQLYLKGGYCCGRSPTLVMEVVICILGILCSFPESALILDVESVLPDWNLRPINLDDGIAKLRQAFVERRELVKHKSIDNSESMLNALTEVCEKLELYRYNALVGSISTPSRESPSST